MNIQRTLKSIASQPTQSKKSLDHSLKEQSADEPSFTETLKESIADVNRLQKEADQAIESLVVGKTKDIAQTMIAVEKANVSFQLMTQVRNRILEAYQEVMRMQQ